MNARKQAKVVVSLLFVFAFCLFVCFVLFDFFICLCVCFCSLVLYKVIREPGWAFSMQDFQKEKLALD